MAWTARIAEVAQNPAPGGGVDARILFSEGSREFYRTINVALTDSRAQVVTKIKAMLGELNRADAVKAAMIAEIGTVISE